MDVKLVVRSILRNAKTAAKKSWEGLQNKAGIRQYDAMILFEVPDKYSEKRFNKEIEGELLDAGFACELEESGKLLAYKEDTKLLKAAIINHGACNVKIIKKGVD